jgi:transcriptional regulator with GAF, ATPase, and Fis domain
VGPKKSAQTLEEVERQHIVRFSRRPAGESAANAAPQDLGLKRTTLEARMQRLGNPPPA